MGWFGEGYRYHGVAHSLGVKPYFTGVGLVAKTTTLHFNRGFMELDWRNFTPKKLIPDCIYITPRQWLKGNLLNAVGLAGPGAKALFDTGEWQKRTENFFISFMPIARTGEERLEEVRDFVKLALRYLPFFKARVGLQLNIYCPNTNHNLDELIREVYTWLNILAVLNIPIMVKINILVDPDAAIEIESHPSCDGLCVPNTIPYGQLPELIPWEKIYGSVSPLQRYGGGGYSGKWAFKPTLRWIKTARRRGLKKAVNIGSILSLENANELLSASESKNDSIFLGSIAVLRPWRMKRIVEVINGQ
jgi:dihydroorotate dehydrogenase